jgi:hypothetical protein
VKGSRITTAVWWFDSVFWGLSSFACYLDDNFTNEPVARSFVAGVARPSRTREGESNGGCGEPPPLAHCGCSDSAFSLRQMVLLCCSNTTAKGPAWR